MLFEPPFNTTLHMDYDVPHDRVRLTLRLDGQPVLTMPLTAEDLRSAREALKARDNAHGLKPQPEPEPMADPDPNPTPEPEAKPLPEVQVAAVTWQDMGDSAAMMRKPLTYDPHEAVSDLVARAFNLGPFARHHEGDRLELQVVASTIPRPQPGTTDPWE